ncbi:MAG: 3-dehydroquinate synthase [Balneolaceae bacterium]
MPSIQIKTSSCSYPFLCGSNILEASVKKYTDQMPFSRCYILVDENVWAFHKARIRAVFDDCPAEYIVEQIPAGEQSKSVKQWNLLLDKLLESGVRRNTPLFAVGGGVTGDLAGFVAASALRGIPLVHLPTTLLAMVDSSIGGKTGINHATGKNLIGAFYQPQMVIADLQFLHTLPEREWGNGLSEILKYGAIQDASIFERSAIFKKPEPLQTSQKSLEDLVLTCAQIKADIVEADEYEAGQRAYLNFGHTFAHAMEKVADFNNLNHGEAVYLGMLAALKLSETTGAPVNDSLLQNFRSLYSFRVSEDMLPIKQLMAAMKSDKKVIDENYRFVLLNNWQQPELKTVNNHELIEQAWNSVYQELR